MEVVREMALTSMLTEDSGQGSGRMTCKMDSAAT